MSARRCPECKGVGHPRPDHDCPDCRCYDDCTKCNGTGGVDEPDKDERGAAWVPYGGVS